ncbi:MAG: tetratricopeptide repeat protein [Planctomycetes bacterium]|nr:tetratricopeptide repeat protein [Planctomycetota bacterium]
MRAFLLGLVLLGAPAQDADEQYTYVAALAEKGLHEQVVREAREFLRANPAHAKAELARYRLACALFELGRSKEAQPEFARLADRAGFEFAAEVQFRLAQCHLDAGERAEAEARLARVLAAKKDYLRAPALALLAQSELARKDHAAALAHFDELARASKDAGYALDARAGRAWCLYRLGKPAEAAAAAEAVLAGEAAGRAGEMAFLLGECRLDQGDARGALAAFRSVGAGEFADAAARGEGFALAAVGDHAAAARAFGRVVREFSQSVHRAECALHEGIELLAAGDAAAAAKALARGELDADPDALGWRARAQAASGARDAALATLERAVGLAPAGERRDALALQRADLLAELGRGAEARADYARVGSARALLAAAVQALEAREPGQAVDLAARLLERFPDSELRTDALLALGEGLFGAGRHGEAAEAFAAAQERDADATRKTRACAREAWSHYLAGDLRRAAERFDAAARGPAELAEVEEAAFMAGRAREDAGERDLAREAWARALQRFPRGAHADEARLRSALAESDGSTAALEELARGLDRGPLAARARFELAERRSHAGDDADALRDYRAALAADPQGPFAARARYGIAWSAFQSKDYSAAAAALRELDVAPSVGAGERSRAKGTDAGPAVPPELAGAARELGAWIALRRGELDVALERWRALGAGASDEARSTSLVRALCAALAKANRAADARAVVEAFAASARTPSARAAASIERVLLLADGGDADGAERALAEARTAAKDDPRLAEAAFRIAEARFAAGEDARAIEAYDAAAASADAGIAAPALYKAGFTRLRAGDAAGAERSLERLVASFPQHELVHESLFLLGEARYRQDDWPAAVEALERVRREAPRHAVLPKVLFRLGLAQGRQEHWKECAETLAELVKRAPEFPNLAEAELWRGRARGALGDARGARAAFDRVLALDKGLLSAAAHLEIGRLYFDAGDEDGALSEFLKVAVLYAGDDEVCEALVLAGQVLEAQGKPAEAAKQYREAREKHPKARYAAEAARRLAELTKR